MTDIASLAVRLAMEDGKFRQGMQRANKAMDRMERNSKQTNRAMKTMQTTMSSMKTTLIGFAAAMGASFSAQSVKGAIEFGDGIAKTADNNGDYCPENCRWATDRQQANNKSNNLTYTLDGRTQTLAQWADEYGVSRDLVYGRLRRNWSIHDALTKPIGNNGRK